MYSVQCTVYMLQCTVYSVHCTLYIVQCTVYSVQYKASLQWESWSVSRQQSAGENSLIAAQDPEVNNLQWTLNSEHYAVHSVHFKVSAVDHPNFDLVTLTLPWSAVNPLRSCTALYCTAAVSCTVLYGPLLFHFNSAFHCTLDEKFFDLCWLKAMIGQSQKQLRQSIL